MRMPTFLGPSAAVVCLLLLTDRGGASVPSGGSIPVPFDPDSRGGVELLPQERLQADWVLLAREVRFLEERYVKFQGALRAIEAPRGRGEVADPLAARRRASSLADDYLTQEEVLRRAVIEQLENTLRVLVDLEAQDGVRGEIEELRMEQTREARVWFVAWANHRREIRSCALYRSKPVELRTAGPRDP